MMMTMMMYCHSLAQLQIISSEFWRNALYTGWLISNYTLTSSANSLALAPWRSNSLVRSSMYTRIITWPMPLPCITPLNNVATSEIFKPTLVRRVRPAKKFLSQCNVCCMPRDEWTFFLVGHKCILMGNYIMNQTVSSAWSMINVWKYILSTSCR